ncbi:MAG TPA: hypothetical protein VK425_11555 [Acidimicrobiales bacterium]|nr:hypothetical protein [Acidimicrobiales bacterium]
MKTNFVGTQLPAPQASSSGTFPDNDQLAVGDLHAPARDLSAIGGSR